MRVVRRLTAALAAATAAFLGLPATGAVASAPIRVASGQTGGYPWTLAVSTTTLGSAKIPGICVTFLWAWAPGQPVGNGFPTCVAPARGRPGRHGVRWSFDLHGGGYHGAVPLQSGGGSSATWIRSIVVLVDPRARSVDAALSDGETLRMKTRALPHGVRRAARLAWIVDSPTRAAAANATVRSLRGLDRHGRVVARFGRGR
jgi:hypothetical protein